MVNESSQPKPGDAVLGGQNPEPLINAAVLGGIEGAKQRYTNPDFKTRIAGLREAVKYSEQGIELLLHGVKDEVLEVRWVADSLLQQLLPPELKMAFEICNLYELNCTHVFTTDSSSKFVTFSPNGQLLAATDGTNIKLWNIETGKLKTTLFWHTDSIPSFAFSPNGEILASGSVDQNIKLWNVETGKLKTTLSGHSNAVISLAFKPDGKYLTSIDNDSNIKLWDIETRKTTFSQNLNFQIPDYRYTHIVFSSNKQLFTISTTADGSKVFDAETARLKNMTLSSHSHRAAFSPNGLLVATATIDYHNGCTVKLWDVETSKLKTTFSGNASDFRSVAFSISGQILATGGSDNTIKLWDVETATLKSTLYMPSRSSENTGFSDCVFSPNGQLFVSYRPHYNDRNPDIIMWEAEISSLKRLNLLEIFQSYFGLRASIKSSLSAAVQTFNTGTPAEQEAVFLKLKNRHEPVVKAVLWRYINSIEPQVASTYKLLKYFLALNRGAEAKAESENILFDHLGSKSVMTISEPLALSTLTAIYDLWKVYLNVDPSLVDDQNQLYFCKALKSKIEELTYCVNPDFKVRVTELLQAVTQKEQGKELLLRALQDKALDIRSIAYSLLQKNAEPEFKMVLESLYKYEWLNCISTTKTPSDSYSRVSAFSPNGQILSFTKDGRNICLWDVATGSLKHTLSGHSHGVGVLAFSPNGEILASGSSDLTIKLWDVETGTLKHTTIVSNLGHNFGYHVESLAFSPNGQLLAYKLKLNQDDSRVELLDVETGTLKNTFTDCAAKVVTFSPNGQLLACCCKNIIKLFDVETGKLKTTIPTTFDYCHVAFSPRGQFLASFGWEKGIQGKVIKLWDVETGSLKQFFSENLDNYCSSFGFSPNGQVIVGIESGGIKLWDVETGKLIYSATFGGVQCFAFTSNGQILTFGQRTISLWEIETPNTNIFDPVEVFHSYLEIKQPKNSSLFAAIQSLKSETTAEQEAAFSLLKSSQEFAIQAVLWPYIKSLEPKVALDREWLKYFLALGRWQEAQEETEKIFIQELGCTGVEGINDTSKIEFLSAIYELWAIYAKVEPQVDFFKALKMRIEHLNNTKAENARINAESRANNSEVYITRSHAMMDDL